MAPLGAVDLGAPWSAKAYRVMGDQPLACRVAQPFAGSLACPGSSGTRHLLARRNLLQRDPGRAPGAKFGASTGDRTRVPSVLALSNKKAPPV
jgi:hypothetical protein